MLARESKNIPCENKLPNHKIDMAEVTPTLRKITQKGNQRHLKSLCTVIDLTLCQQEAFQEAAFVGKACDLLIAF